MGILGWLSRFGSRNEKPVGRGKYYETGGGWGNAINFTEVKPNRSIQSIVGWKRDIPRVGDFVVSPMASGKRGAWQVIEVKPCCDPPDMFFATVEWSHYIEQEGVLTNS